MDILPEVTISAHTLRDFLPVPWRIRRLSLGQFALVVLLHCAAYRA
jgi:hypothetical protein